jgi:CheY-like chemotaxis protein
MTGARHTDSPLPDHQPSERVCVLVVDDNPDIVRTCAVLLRFAGLDVLTASNGHDAIHLVEKFHPQVVLLDVGLPGLDGCEVARRLRADPTLQTMTLLAVTAYGTEDDRRRAEAAGFDHFLVKPVPFRHLLSFIRPRSQTLGNR